MNSTELLIKARARVELAWYQGSYNEPNADDLDTCGVCLIGALNWATSGDPGKIDNDENFGVWLDARARIADALYHDQNFIGRFTYPLDRFNDHPTTTKEDVLAVFDRAIARSLVSA